MFVICAIQLLLSLITHEQTKCTEIPVKFGPFWPDKCKSHFAVFSLNHFAIFSSRFRFLKRLINRKTQCYLGELRKWGLIQVIWSKVQTLSHHKKGSGLPWTLEFHFIPQSKAETSVCYQQLEQSHRINCINCNQKRAVTVIHIWFCPRIQAEQIEAPVRPKPGESWCVASFLPGWIPGRLNCHITWRQNHLVWLLALAGSYHDIVAKGEVWELEPKSRWKQCWHCFSEQIQSFHQGLDWVSRLAQKLQIKWDGPKVGKCFQSIRIKTCSLQTDPWALENLPLSLFHYPLSSILQLLFNLS